MKRASFRPGFAELRGNISGKQNLQYAENNNPAYDGPVGKKNYARNYQASVIISKRASDGLIYFGVRTKSANHLTRKAKKAMAALGGTGALIGAILRDKSTAIYQGIYSNWLERQEAGIDQSLRKYMTDQIIGRLKSGISLIYFPGITGAAVSVKNPWFDGEMTEGAEVSSEVLAKFWDELCPNGVLFTVEGQKGIAFNGATFEDVIDQTGMNILSLTTFEIGSTAYVKQGNLFLLDKDGGYPTDQDNVGAGSPYTLTSVSPTA